MPVSTAARATAAATGGGTRKSNASGISQSAAELFWFDQFGDRVRGGDLHLVVHVARLDIERPAEYAGERQ